MFESRDRVSEDQQEFWVETRRLPKATASTFYRKLNDTLNDIGLTEGVREICRPAYADAEKGGRDDLSTQFAVIQKEAKVPKTRTQNGKQGSLSFHSLRHSFVTWMSNAEVPAQIRKKMSGHSTDAAHAAYTSLEFGTLTAAVAKLPALPE